MAHAGEARSRLPAREVRSQSAPCFPQVRRRRGSAPLDGIFNIQLWFSRCRVRRRAEPAGGGPPMPAVTVDDLTTLARLPEPKLGDQPRPVWQVTTAPGGYGGEGFPVRRGFAGIDMALLDPFIMMDQMGGGEYAPGEPKGTPWHPPRGFETVTYIIDGVFDHQDSHGGGGSITNGDTQWMTAGSGLLHIETPPEWLVQAGGLFHGIQLWVNLPRDAKWNPPAYQDIRSSQVGLAASADAGALVRVIAGDLGVTKGPGSTYTPMTMVHATVEPGARLDLPWDVDYN